jgi:hypothetical protein
MITKSIELTHEFIDSIVLSELQSALESNVNDYHNNVRVCETRKEHRRLIESLRRTVAYFMAHDEFVEYMRENIDWPEDMDTNPIKW